MPDTPGTFDHEAEINLFLHALREVTGYQLKDYARASLSRRVDKLLQDQGVHHPAELIPLLIHNLEFRAQCVSRLTVSVTELFRDPGMFQHLQTQVLPMLASYPSITVWIAGCASGEEAYSTAILFQEAGLLGRTQIHATDISNDQLAQGKTGVIHHGIGREEVDRYRKAGGKASLLDYFTLRSGKQKLHNELLQAIDFHHHDLVQDRVFTSAQLILCRNTLIYFNRSLQEQVIGLLTESLVERGYLVLGPKEQLSLSSHFKRFETINEAHRLFRLSR